MGTRSAEELVRVVTARQLARETSRLLDELHREGTCLLVTRHGYPVAAMYAAGTSNLRAAIRSAATMAEPPDAGTVDVTAELERLALDPSEQRVLEGFLEKSTLDEILALGLELQEVMRAAASLQFKQLVVRDLMGYKPTMLGRTIAKALRERRLA